MYSHPATRQDEWVLSRISRPGRYCEVGAYDGKTHSNTLALEEQGWQGILVEPNPQAYRRMEAYRGNKSNKLYQVALDATMGVLPFIVGDQYSGLIQYMPGDWMHEHRRRANPTVAVDAITLDQLLANESEIDYLSIDTEGSEHAILNAYSWRIKPRLLTVEFRYDGDLLRKFRRLLEPKGYTLMELRGFDACFELDYDLPGHCPGKRP